MIKWFQVSRDEVLCSGMTVHFQVAYRNLSIFDFEWAGLQKKYSFLSELLILNNRFDRWKWEVFSGNSDMVWLKTNIVLSITLIRNSGWSYRDRCFQWDYYLSVKWSIVLLKIVNVQYPKTNKLLYAIGCIISHTM